MLFLAITNIDNNLVKFYRFRQLLTNLRINLFKFVNLANFIQFYYRTIRKKTTLGQDLANCYYD